MLSFFAIVTNLITYLTKSLHQDIATAAKNVNYWSGVTTLIPLIGSYLAAPTQPASQWSCLLPQLFHVNPKFKATQYGDVFGSRGIKPCLGSLGDEQFDDHHSEERKRKCRTSIGGIFLLFVASCFV
ncbi:hypothetical protein WN944_017917 [Citrus x changshan-huyou]|uniref:Uncharacterized protein n=1 Tax=Citrus x changshan-huyou TaxID=2935761 RepID=A0AAP0QEY2_9ROSI